MAMSPGDAVSLGKSGFGRTKGCGPAALFARQAGEHRNASAFRIAGVQMASGPDVASNLKEARRLISMAADQGVVMVALPEYFAIMGMKDTDKVQVRERPGNGPIQDFLAELSSAHKIWLFGCSVPLESAVDGKVHNSLMVYDPEGALAARYDKIHLFNLDLGKEKFSEQRTISPGAQVTVVDTPFGRVGLSVCYDLRFPELYRAMAGVEIIVVPSAFTETTGRAHWNVLIRARAIENLAYVLAPAQGGYHLSGRETHGHSMIVDPWGVILDELPRGSGVVVASVNRDYLTSLRNSLPALSHRVV